MQNDVSTCNGDGRWKTSADLLRWRLGVGSQVDDDAHVEWLCLTMCGQSTRYGVLSASVMALMGP